MKIVRIVMGVVSGVCLAWALALWATGGFDVPILGKVLSSHDARRPVLFGSVALTLFILTGGRFRVPSLPLARLRRLRIDDRWIAGSLAAATFAIGMAYCTMAVGGSDSYGYVSEADLFLAGTLRVEQPWVAHAPWPSARWSFTPAGYHPQEGPRQWDILPTYAPGLPLLMAGAKLAAGQCGVFAVVPFLGAVMVLATFGIGRRLGSSRAGVVAAWLVATSPAFLFMLMAPMSDVAVSGVWAAVFFCLLGRGFGSIVAAGLLTGLAVMIRPNLFFLVGILGLWFLIQAWYAGAGGRSRHLVRGLVYGASAAPGILFIAWMNWHLRGTPLESGYGSLAGMFALAHVLPNIRNYASFFAESQTPFEAIGLVALLVPIRRFWSGVGDRSLIVVGGLFVLAIYVHYMLFLEFDAWWYLRFLLPCWPLLMLGIGGMAASLMSLRKPALTVAVTLAVIALGVRGFNFALDKFTFELWKVDHKYVAIAQLVENLTDPNSVIISMQHSGSLRYYGGRMTLRYDGLDSFSLDTAVNWLTGHGIHVYALLEDWELEAVKQRFVGQRNVSSFDRRPIFVYESPGPVSFIDFERSADPSLPVERIVGTGQGPRCVPPQPAPHLVFKP